MDFLKVKLNWTRNFVLAHEKILEENHKMFPNRNKWNCDCHVVHDTDKDIKNFDFNFLRKAYEPISKEVCLAYGLKYKHVSDIWYNYYKTNQFQEPHIHEGNGLTAIHYLLYNPKIHKPTKFTNKELDIPEVQQDDLLFFPNSFEHYVEKSENKFPRLTVAFTVACE